MFLTCNSVSTLVTDPNNFVGPVRITTPEQALEFVRFFSNPDTYEWRRSGRAGAVPSYARTPMRRQLRA
jgi:ABC-type glycerol-3-phosphate transport system substrate-binding protein